MQSDDVCEYIRSNSKVSVAIAIENTLFGKWYTVYHNFGPYSGETAFEEGGNVKEVVNRINKSYRRVL